jgi:hypothetical protein
MKNRFHAISANVSCNDEAPPPRNLAQHLPEHTARWITNNARETDAAGFGRTQQPRSLINM